MLFIALVKFKTQLSKEVVAQNTKDIEDDMKREISFLGMKYCHMQSIHIHPRAFHYKILY